MKKSKNFIGQSKQLLDKYQHYAHAHLYYAGGILSLALFFLTLTQAVITHVSGNLYLAFLQYFMAVLFLAIARRCHRRGKVHYSY